MLRIAYKNRSNKILSIAPTRLIVVSFAILILTGTLLLMLPVASRNGQSAGFLTSFFTATSATCVTGLVVVDSYNHWTPFGQLIILFLIQAGGLGIITLATFFSALFGRKLGLKGMILAQESISHLSFQGIIKIIRDVVLVTFIIEAAGALLLSIRFIPRFGLTGLYISIFHSISAFCNSGFDLMGITGAGDFVSLTAFNNDPIVIYTTALLIIIGGLGFLVWRDVYSFRQNKQLLLHTKVVFIITGSLLAFGAVMFFVLEGGNPATMGLMSTSEKINASVFHSVVPRTAGFNSLPVDQMTDISKFLTILLMFIGAAPGSTGGGIKVTTFGVLLFAIISQIRGSEDTLILKKKIQPHIVSKALTITGLGAILVLVVTSLILAIENRPLLSIFYEVTSAFGTVGLSTGITPVLHPASKLLLIATMFLGRVGPLTFAIALTLRRAKKDNDVVYPEGKIVVG